MRPHTYFIFVLALPLLLPGLAWPLVYVDVEPLRIAGQLLLGSLVVGGIPYLLFAVLAAQWARGRTEAEMRKGALAAPVLFLVPLLGVWTLLFSRGDGGSPFATLAFFALFGLAFGYAYVLLALGVYRVLIRRGKIGPVAAGAPLLA